ncbi:hypothetical protein NQ318_015519 [Aromia moschata]|uniref:Uncharacterized protein n=1 Tax=Aromia moschata TaxID=1265417 RepID=A0AAV8XT45_9CUCU|nr:hypothetical protein NQ318_015519 [Aromia moschata]
MDAKRKRVKVWTAKKEQYFTRIQQLLDISKDVTTPEKIAKFKLKLETVEKTKNSLLEALDEINLLECDLNEDFVPNYAVLDVVDEMMCQIISVEKKFKKLPTQQASTESYSSLNILERFDSTVTALLKLNIDNLADYFYRIFGISKT